jgi:8-oxo-dGTP diphosphatase
MTNIPYTFSTNPPSSTSCYTQVAGCFCSVGEKFLLLKRHSDKPQGGTWCLPAGKMEKGETPLEAVLREVKEETGIDLCSTTLNLVGTFTIEHEKGRIIFHTYSCRLQKLPDLSIDETESVEYRWTSYNEIDKLDLILAGKEVLSHCQLHL